MALSGPKINTETNVPDQTKTNRFSTTVVIAPRCGGQLHIYHFSLLTIREPEIMVKSRIVQPLGEV